jgi:hypothetical protein
LLGSKTTTTTKVDKDEDDDQQNNKGSHPIPESAKPSAAHLRHIEKLLRPIGPSVSENLSIQRSLNQFTSVDCLDGENKFACENCYKLTVDDKEEEEEEEEEKEAEQVEEEKIEETKEEVEGGTYAPSQIIALSSEQQEGEDAPSMSIKPQELEGETGKDDQEEAASSPTGATTPEGSASESDSGTESSEGEYTDRFGNTIPKPVKEKKKHCDKASIEPTTAAAGTTKAEAKTSKFVFRKAYKRYLISQLPPTLVLHLKRFEQSGRFGQMRKIEDQVDIPVELDMAPYFVPKSDFDEEEEKERENSDKDESIIQNKEDGEQQQKRESKRYRLYGAVVHMGTLGGGHYTNYVLSSKVDVLDKAAHVNGNKAVEGSQEKKEVEGEKDDQDCRQWIACSDTSVRQASLKEVLSSRAYLLFYERV